MPPASGSGNLAAHCLGQRTQHVIELAERTITGPSAVRGVASTSSRSRVSSSRFEVIVGTASLVAAAAAVWLTLRADFLAHPGWLAVQKADLILGPVLTGLYWRRRRPHSRFWPVLIVAGFLSAIYILQSSATPWVFSLGVIWEGPIYVATLALILAFPTGRLDGLLPRLMLGAGIVAAGLTVVTVMVAPVIGANGSISGCLTACPENAVLGLGERPARPMAARCE